LFLPVSGAIGYKEWGNIEKKAENIDFSGIHGHFEVQKM